MRPDADFEALRPALNPELADELKADMWNVVPERLMKTGRRVLTVDGFRHTATFPENSDYQADNPDKRDVSLCNNCGSPFCQKFGHTAIPLKHLLCCAGCGLPADLVDPA